MQVSVFYVTDLNKISEKFLEKTGKDIKLCEDILITNYPSYDGWCVKVIY